MSLQLRLNLLLRWIGLSNTARMQSIKQDGDDDHVNKQRPKSDSLRRCRISLQRLSYKLAKPDKLEPVAKSEQILC